MAITARNIDIVTVGEVLIDLTQTGVDERGVRTLAANPGGAPANVAVAASRLGTKTAFVGCIGTDAFGDSLRETLEKDGVDTTGLIAHETIPTTLAVVTVNPDGERSFTFYREGREGRRRHHHVRPELPARAVAVRRGGHPVDARAARHGRRFEDLRRGDRPALRL